MTNEKKTKLIKYLYPTDKIRHFMCNDFYQELLNYISVNILICTQNKTNKIREENVKFARDKILWFLQNNNSYVDELKILFRDDKIFDRVDDFVIGLTFFVSCINNKFNEIDIFKNKESICFCEVSIIDLL